MTRRRRPSLRAYVRRRWRAVGLVLVLLAGSLLVLAATDRGHDPVWDARSGEVDQVALAPDASRTYALVRNATTIVGLEARDGADGRLLWKSDIVAPRALVRAGEGGVAVATDFPRAFLTLFDPEGALLWQIALEGNPRAMAVSGETVALALQAPGNPVLVAEGGQVVRVHRFAAFVSSLDLRGERLVVGTSGGEVATFSKEGASVLNLSLPLSVRSVRVTADGTGILVGGFSFVAGDLSGGIAYLDVPQERVRWSQPTRVGVGLVGLDANGLVALAVEETPPRHTLRAFDVATGAQRWARVMDGVVQRDDAGAFGGAALSPDGQWVVVSTLRGPLQGLSAADGSVAWEYAHEGSTILGFARDTPAQFVANARLVQNGPYQATLVFDASEEPSRARLPVVALTLVAIATAAGALFLAVGYWRVRRTL